MKKLIKNMLTLGKGVNKDMKRAGKVIAVILLSAVMAGGGYIAGQKVQMDSITSAIPRKTIENTIEPERNEPPGNEESQGAKAPEAIQPEKNIIEKNSSSAIQNGWTEVKKVTANLSDDTKAEVKLYTSAEKDADGEFIWDDGNQWVLEAVTDNGSFYTLINKYVQLGNVNITVGADEKGDCVITAVISTGTGLSVEKYTYNGTAFEGQTVYNSGVLNIWGSTF